MTWVSSQQSSDFTTTNKNHVRHVAMITCRVGYSYKTFLFLFFFFKKEKKSFSLNISWLSSICCTCGVPKVSICLLFSGYTASFEQRIISHYSQMSAIDSLSHSVSSGTLASKKELPVSAANQCQITLI